MNKLALGLATLIFVGAASAQNANKAETIQNQAGNVSVTWQAPDKFRDIKSSGEIQSRFQKRLFNHLTKELGKEAAKVLKQNQKLNLTFTDVDLAGDLRPNFGSEISDLRIVKDIYPPRFKFSYSVTQDGKTIAEGNENITDLGFLDRIHSNLDRPFKYETRLLNSWMEKMVKSKL